MSPMAAKCLTVLVGLSLGTRYRGSGFTDGDDGEDEQTLVNCTRTVKFTWTHGGKEAPPKEVSVFGSWNGWHEGTPLVRPGNESNEFSAVLEFPCGRRVEFQYKFIVDGQWRVAEDQPTKQEHGTTNNVLKGQVLQAYSFEEAPQELSKNKTAVLNAVKRRGLDLRFAHETLQGDPDVVLAAVEERGDALEFASETLRNDRKIVMAAVRRHGRALAYASAGLKKDAGVVLAAIDRWGSALEHADEELRRNKSVVLAAVKRNRHALQFADEALKDDEEVVTAAMEHHWSSLRYAHKKALDKLDGELPAVIKYKKALEMAALALPGLKIDEGMIGAGHQE